MTAGKNGGASKHEPKISLMDTTEQPAHRAPSIYFCAPVNALVEGIYRQKIPFSDIRRHGDFGLGTFDDLDGEMVMLDGDIYQITSDGSVAMIDMATLTPFSCVTFYEPASHDNLERETPYPEFQEWLFSLLPSPNIFYAIRIEGTFSSMKVRSVPRQENYRPLAEVAKDQPTFEFREIEGTLVGFYTPSFMGSVSVPGLHLHFLSSDRRHGGHLLECTAGSVRAGIQFITALELALPMNFDYLSCDFRRDVEKDLESAER